MMVTRWGVPTTPSDDRHDEVMNKEAEMSEFPAKILVATDGSEDAMLAAAELHVVHVGPAHVYPPRAAGPALPTGTEQELRQQAQGVLAWQVDEITKAGGEITTAYLRMGHPSEEILSLSEEIIAGLIVVGNQGLGRRFSRMRRFLMGSVSEKVSRYARCSVMVVRRDLYERRQV
jgi:nucleotide-binding universal stress UspA family protein